MELDTVTINSNKTSGTISVQGPYAYLEAKNTTVPGTVSCGQNVVAWSGSNMCE